MQLPWDTALELDELLLLMRLPLAASSSYVVDGISRQLKISAGPQQLELHWQEFGDNAPLHWGCLKELTTYLRKLVTSRFHKKLRSEDPYFQP
ncbi:MAG: hypothetical protein EOP83_19055 [Verrucomicrobiaceae bacterium]|nr:MAG: hypothetical protein EOP83_19055 [Verrucomicrobiaceae bacterium]